MQEDLYKEECSAVQKLIIRTNFLNTFVKLDESGLVQERMWINTGFNNLNKFNHFNDFIFFKKTNETAEFTNPTILMLNAGR